MNNIEGVAYPFAIVGGRVHTTSDPTEIAVDRVTLCLGTQVGERVMRPSMGIDIMKVVWELEVDAKTAIPEAVAQAFRSWFPAYYLKKVHISTPYENDPTMIQAEITFKTNPNNQFDTVSKVGIQVPEGSEIYNQERIFS